MLYALIKILKNSHKAIGFYAFVLQISDIDPFVYSVAVVRNGSFTFEKFKGIFLIFQKIKENVLVPILTLKRKKILDNSGKSVNLLYYADFLFVLPDIRIGGAFPELRLTAY